MKRILVIDDDEVFRSTVYKALPEETYEVVLTKDGDEGLVKYAEKKPDLILLDINMPKMDGISFLKKINVAGQIPTPTLIISDNSELDTIGEGIALGIRGYLVKSDSTLDTILENVERTIPTEPSSNIHVG